jgi:SpoVK/Ycf46/Vps4 family AAA+-type ATPase
MARSDLLLSLVRAATQGDSVLLRRSVEALIAEERGKQHHVLATRLEEQLRRSNGAKVSTTASPPDARAQNLLHEVAPQRVLAQLILPDVVKNACEELVEEHQRADLLRSYNLEPRNRILLIGPPGNGKTTLAEAVADALLVPLFVVRYEGIIGSYLGETASRLLRLFEYVQTRRCVLFFDEFDTVGKERGDTHETGEIKRVVSSLLMQVDRLPSHVVVVAATNHSELLDRAVWRRFQLRLELPKPTQTDIAEWFARFQADLGQPLGISNSTLARRLFGLSFAEVEEFGLDIKRRWVLGIPDGSLKRITTERLRQWEARTRTRRKTQER